jgi:chromosome segregation ATPase
VTESIPASILDGLTLEVVEWLPSGAETGLVRVRGRWAPGVARPEGLPVLCAVVGGGVSRCESLPDAPSGRLGNGSIWRGAYLLPEAIARSGVWLEWESGERSALPAPAGLDERAAPVLEAVPESLEEPGGEVIDRAVLAERRARRAEAAEQAQARVASEALRALDAVELRGTELEAQVESLLGERDELVGRVASLEQRSPRDEHARAALSDALAAAAAARRRAQDLQIRMRAAEVARSSDAVRLRVLEARESSGAWLRDERAAQEAELVSARSRAVALEAEAGRARSQAVAAAADLDDARRDVGGRLAAATAELADREAELSGARAELEDVRAELGEARSHAERAQASAEAALADARAAAETDLAAVHDRLSEATTAAEEQARATQARIADLGAALEAERAARAAAGAQAETARGEASVASASLAAERVARASLEGELDRERAARSALSDALDAETAALASLHTELNAVRERAEAAPDPAALTALQEELTRERAARQADQSALAALRDDLAAERAALAEVRAQLDTLRDDLAAQVRAEMESAREADRAVLAALRADLNAERAAREADQADLARLRSRLAEAESEGGLLDRVAELDRRAAGLADELELQRRAREQAEAAASAARTSDEEPGRMVADLDAAASALRERATNGAVEAPSAGAGVAEVVPEEAASGVAEVAPEEAASAEAGVEAPGVDAPAVEPPDVEAPDEEPAPAATPPEKRPIVSAPAGPSRALATGRSQRQYPRLRGALVKLAHDDPAAAGRLIAGLLPVQSAIVQGPVDYDITIAEVGTFAVTVAGGRAYVKDLDAPRGRREAEFHLSADALTLAELIAGVPHKIGRFRGAARVSGRKRRLKPLKAIPGATLSLAEAAKAGARLEPGLVFRTFPYVIQAAWSRDHSFTIAQQLAGDPPGTWYVTVGNGSGIRVTTTEPAGGADATVTMTPEGFGHLLRGEPTPPGHRPIVRGDREAVALLKAWIDRAQAG